MSAGGVAAKASTAPQMEKIVQHLMDKASLTAESVAQAIYDAVEAKRFLVLPHPDDRKRALIKRVSPELYFRQALKATAEVSAKAIKRIPSSPRRRGSSFKPSTPPPAPGTGFPPSRE